MRFLQKMGTSNYQKINILSYLSASYGAYLSLIIFFFPIKVHVDCEQTQEPKIKALMNSKEFLYYCPKCKLKLKNKPTTLKRPKKELDERLFAKFRPKKAMRASENNHQALIARMHKQSGEEYLDPFVKEGKLNNEESNNFENLNINKNV